MNKKILLFAMAFLMLFTLAPAMAAPAVKTPYTADVVLDVTELGEEWVTEDGILQVRGRGADGSFISAALPETGSMHKEFDLTVDMNTGEGTIRGKFLLEVGAGIIEGSFRGIITGYTHLAGTVVGHGAGEYEGIKTMGAWEGDVIGSQIVNTLEAILLSPRS